MRDGHPRAPFHASPRRNLDRRPHSSFSGRKSCACLSQDRRTSENRSMNHTHSQQSIPRHHTWAVMRRIWVHMLSPFRLLKLRPGMAAGVQPSSTLQLKAPPVSSPQPARLWLCIHSSKSACSELYEWFVMWACGVAEWRGCGCASGGGDEGLSCDEMRDE